MRRTTCKNLHLGAAAVAVAADAATAETSIEFPPANNPANAAFSEVPTDNNAESAALADTKMVASGKIIELPTDNNAYAANVFHNSDTILLIIHLHAVAASLPLVLVQPSANDDMDVIVGVPIGAACNLTAAFQAEGSVGVGAKCLVPTVLADALDVKVGAAISDVCNLKAAPGKLSQAEDAVGLAAKSPYQADTSVNLALLQVGASDGNQSQVSSVMT